MASFRARMALAVAAAVLGLGVARPVAPAANDEALIETIVQGLEERDRALGEFHLSVFCRSWMSDTQIAAEGRYFRETLKVDGPPQFQNQGLSVSDLCYRGSEWRLDSALLVSDGISVPPGFLGREDAGAKSLDPDRPGWGVPAARMCCDGKQIWRYVPKTGRGEVRKVKGAEGARGMIDRLLGDMLVWIGGPVGEYFRENPPYAVEGPLQVDGHQCYHLSYARSRPEAIGPFRRDVWVAPSLGYAIVRESNFLVEHGSTDSGSRKERHATRFREVAPGVWLPTEVVCHNYGYYKGFDKPWRGARVYTVREVQVGAGTAPGNSPFQMRFPIGVVYTIWDETGSPVYQGSERADFETREESTLVRELSEWTPPPCDDRLNRPLTQADVDALLADVARAEAAREANGEGKND